jgi:hypothetical protein
MAQSSLPSDFVKTSAPTKRGSPGIGRFGAFSPANLIAGRVILFGLAIMTISLSLVWSFAQPLRPHALAP